MRACPGIADATGFAVRPLTIVFTAALASCSRIEGQFSPKCLRHGETSEGPCSRGGPHEASMRGKPHFSAGRLVILSVTATTSSPSIPTRPQACSAPASGSSCRKEQPQSPQAPQRPHVCPRSCRPCPSRGPRRLRRRRHGQLPLGVHPVRTERDFGVQLRRRSRVTGYRRPRRLRRPDFRLSADHRRRRRDRKPQSRRL